MSFNAATLRLMAGKGLSASDIAELAEAMEGGQRSAAAARQKRYRENRRNERDVTRDVTPPPIDNTHTPHSVSNETGSAEPDPVKMMFDLGVSMLKDQGHGEKQARSIIGSWRKGRAPGDVVSALVDARTRSISNLVEWMPKRLSGTKPAEPQPLWKHLAEGGR